MTGKRAVVLLSGGMDSTTLAYLLRYQHEYELTAVSIYYGQRHQRELFAAQQIATELAARHHIVNISEVGKLLTGSALTDPSVPVPEGHYADETMRTTVVPNRNAILLSIAFGIAAAEGADRVGIAIHAGDHAIYPDCRPEFRSAFQLMESHAFGDMWPHVKLYAPFVHQSKAEIASLGIDLGVPYELTWSCYKGGLAHCGKCGTCVERREAFELAGVPDPTVYEP